MDVYNVMVEGVPLIFVVMGLVQWISEFGVKGNYLRGVSMLVGLLFGGGYMLAANGQPADFAGYFGFAVYGVGLGLVASGVYDTGKKILSKGLSLLLQE